LSPVESWPGRIIAKVNPTQFIQEVRQEVARVTWPTRKETLQTTAMVFVMVFIAAGFFFLIDQVFSAGVRLVFGFGH
jgi:preprotein translocase subunit SecE